MSETELILVNISGSDRPGVTSALTEVLARYDASILDIGQADIHHTLSLGLLFKNKCVSVGKHNEGAAFQSVRTWCAD